jgi:hypothetical protein
VEASKHLDHGEDARVPWALPYKNAPEIETGSRAVSITVSLPRCPNHAADPFNDECPLTWWLAYVLEVTARSSLILPSSKK